MAVMKDGKSGLEQHIVEEAHLYCGHFIEPNLGTPKDPKTIAMATCNVISRLVFGGRAGYTDPEYIRLTKSVEKLFHSNIMASTTKNMPFAKHFRMSALGDSKDALDSLANEMHKRIKKSREELDSDNPSNIFDHCLIKQSTSTPTGDFHNFGGVLSQISYK